MTSFFLDPLVDAVYLAGDKALDIYNSDFQVESKDDKSPVTAADLEVDRIVVAELEKLFPDIAIVTEERSASHTHDGASGRFFLVDPIDGTKEFIKKTGEFTVNIALVENGVPVSGIVYAPAMDRLFIGDLGVGCEERKREGETKPIRVRANPIAKMTAVASRSHNTPETQAFLDAHEITDCVSAGSSLKLCVVAAGEADVYPRFGPTMEWDTAAGHSVLLASGGMVLLEDGQPLLYGKADYRNPYFIACSPDAKNRCGL